MVFVFPCVYMLMCVFFHSQHKRDLSYIFFMNECVLLSV